MWPLNGETSEEGMPHGENSVCKELCTRIQQKQMRGISASLLKSPRITFANIKSSITGYKSLLHVVSPNDSLDIAIKRREMKGQILSYSYLLESNERHHLQSLPAWKELWTGSQAVNLNPRPGQGH